MGITKRFLLEQMEANHRQDVREWLQDKLGRAPSEAEIDAGWDDFELAQACRHAMDEA
jgi:hypothetical protein